MSAVKLKSPKPRVERQRGLFSYTGARYLEEDTDLSGDWDVSFKIDGIRMIRGNDDKIYSRMGTEQLEHIQLTMPDWLIDAELFGSDWATSMSKKAGTLPVCGTDFYSLNPIDERLHIGSNMQLTHEYVASLLEWALSLGYEGIVIRKAETAVWIKVVPAKYADVRVTGFVEATGEQVGHMASLCTSNWGRVSLSTLTREQKKWCWDNRVSLLGCIVEAKYRERFGGGKLRFARFHRWRFDKDTESI